jgi:transcriptional regulator with XRE-family HTH domain
METISAISSVEDLGGIVRTTRKRQRMTQAELAARSHVSRQFLVELEAGHPRAELSKVIDVLSGLGLTTTVSAQTAQGNEDPDLDTLNEHVEVRRDRKFYTNLALHEAVLRHLNENPQLVLRRGTAGAKTRLAHVSGGASDLIREWTTLLAAENLDAIRSLLTGDDEHSVEMRNVTPFLDVLSQDERTEILQREQTIRRWQQ